MAINSDITEKKAAEQELVTYAEALQVKNRELATALKAACEASDVKSRFLASVSHKLRTPLKGIIGFSQPLHDGVLGPITAEQQGCLGDVLASSHHLLGLINQVLDLSRVESGKMEIQCSRVRLEDLVRKAIDGLLPIARAKNIEVRSKVDPRVCTAETDPARIRQIVFNFLSNALKFTPEGGLVEVEILADGETNFRIQVRDNGIGIAEADLPRLFTEFGQLTTGQESGGGTGLGLVITKRIAEALHGTVGVASVKGASSCFWAVLPLVGSNG